MTRLEIRTEIRALLNDESATPRFTDVKINFRLNHIHKMVANNTKVLKSSAIDQLASGVQEYSLPESTDVLEVERVRVTDNTDPANVSKFALLSTSMEEMDYLNPSWENIEGRPRKYYLRGNALGVFPKPSTAENGFDVTIFYSDKAIPLDLDGDVPRYPDQYHDVVILGVVEWCKREDNDYDEARTYESKFTRRMAKMKSEQDSRKGTMYIMKPFLDGEVRNGF